MAQGVRHVLRCQAGNGCGKSELSSFLSGKRVANYVTPTRHSRRAVFFEVLA